MFDRWLRKKLSPVYAAILALRRHISAQKERLDYFEQKLESLPKVGSQLQDVVDKESADRLRIESLEKQTQLLRNYIVSHPASGAKKRIPTHTWHEFESMTVNEEFADEPPSPNAENAS